MLAHTFHTAAEAPQRSSVLTCLVSPSNCCHSSVCFSVCLYFMYFVFLSFSYDSVFVQLWTTVMQKKKKREKMSQLKIVNKRMTRVTHMSTHFLRFLTQYWGAHKSCQHLHQLPCTLACWIGITIYGSFLSFFLCVCEINTIFEMCKHKA